MTEIKAVVRIRTGSYEEFYNANLVYAFGEQTFITSGGGAGRWKVGDGVTRWRNLPFSPRTAGLNTPGLVAGSNALFYGKVDSAGNFTLNGIAEAVERIDAKDAAQDAALGLHGGSIAALETTVAGMSGAVIYIGKVDKFTGELEAMSKTDRDALLTARAVEIRGRVQDGYTLEDKGLADVAGRFHYWQYQPDGTWFDRGERGDVSVATNADYGVVKGSAQNYEVGVKPDGTMSVNGLATKLNALDAADTEQDGRLDDIGEELGGFKDTQEETNAGVSESLAELGAAIGQEQNRAKDAERELGAAVGAEAEAREQAIEAHEADKDNPHGVTAAQVGLGNVDNTADADKPVSTAQAAAIAEAQLATHTWLPAVRTKALLLVPSTLTATLNYLCRVIADQTAANNGVWELIAGADEWTYFSDNQDWVDETELDAAVGAEAEAREQAIEAHEADKDNPHGVTAAQVGLGNVDNTADADKPVSTAQAAALATRVNKLAGSTDCDLVYVKHADGTQGYQELWAEPEANAIPSRDDNGVLYARAGGGENAVVIKSQMDGAIAAAVAETAGPIEAALPPFFADRDGLLVAGRGGTLIKLNVTEQAA